MVHWWCGGMSPPGTETVMETKGQTATSKATAKVTATVKAVGEAFQSVANPKRTTWAAAGYAL